MAGGTSGTAVMASPRNILEKAFRQMAQGSQADAGTVTAVSTSLLLMHKKGMDNLAEHVAPRPRDLLQALGWLYPCCLPGSLLPPDVKQEALLAWGRCGALCFLLFVQTPVRSQAECVSLVAPRSQPPAPGALVWMNSLATQLTTDVIAELASVSCETMAGQILAMWEHLTMRWACNSTHAAELMTVLQPGLMQLLRRLALQPAPAAVSQEWARNLHELGWGCLPTISMTYGTLLEVDRQQVVEWWGSSSVALAPASSGATASSNSSSSTSSSSRQGFTGCFTPEQRAALLTYQDVWWGGVAGVASSNRLLRSRHSSTSKTKPAALCPTYYTQWQYPVGTDHQQVMFALRFGSACLDVLLLLETQGLMPWALQQLQPYRAAGPLSSSSSSNNSNSTDVAGNGGALQWPLLPSEGDVSSGSHSSSSGGSGGSACNCHALTCYLCTPPPPVTLQQLCLVLEVVCLHCQESTPQALQAPLLLALLLQRASPGVRASFLNSADGDRLLVALQHMACEDQTPPLISTSWSFFHSSGALSLAGALAGTDPHAQVKCGLTRAIHVMAWCFLDADMDGAAATAATAAAAAATSASAGPVLPDSVAQGSVLLCPAHPFTHDRASYLHLLRVPATSLRLAAGVRPSLALLATLEGWLRRSHADTLSLLFPTLLAVIQALLEADAPCSPGCSQQGSPGVTGSGQAGGSSSGGSSSSSSCSSKTTTTTNATITADPVPPMLLEAASSVVVTVSKILRDLDSILPISANSPPCDLRLQRDLVLLGACLSNAVLQLALQQLPPCQQRQQQEEEGISCTIWQLMEGSDRLLYQASRAALAYLRARPAAAQEQTGTARLLVAHLRTGRMRLKALEEAGAKEVVRQSQQEAAGVRASATPAAAGASPGAAEAAPATAGDDQGTPKGMGHCLAAPGPRSGGCGCVESPTAAEAWCPAHSSSPAPLADEEGELVDSLESNMGSTDTFIVPPIFVGCGYPGCNNLAGPSETGLVTNRRGVVCSGCGVARYCSSKCAKDAWSRHWQTCERLAAALGRATASSSSSAAATTSNTHTTCTTANSSSGSSSGGSSANNGSGSTNSSGSSQDIAPARDQRPASSRRVCAWCGVSAPNLLRCGRCKAAWYCGADHQRAAWRGGHKQECGAAAVPANSLSWHPG